MPTENFSTRFQDLDAWPSLDILSAFYEGQLAAVAAVRPALPSIAAAAEEAVIRLRRGGRLVYVGAGTSGRIGVQDGAELPPTFNWPDDRLVYLIAGGEGALLRAVEDAEDSVEQGTAGIRDAGVGPDDVVIGVAASGRTPFTIAALQEAKARGAQTIGISNNPGAPILDSCSHPILADTGEEVIAGSTRMKAGTAQKVILNLLSTLVMVRLGRVYRGLMVHMRATNAKLRRRSEIMVSQITGCDDATAIEALKRANGDMKLASLIALGIDPAQAQAALERSDGNLREALAQFPELSI
ncbi:N-acetylmuramic acid 6-phosphate etherase [Microvirga thermotolerans]|uniref:N-acetylmuramic acid 6-phosphate etherase n=1 Tax=Microvirga thermotolerans TaxID=2651334 RepID=A0A5P9JZR7_9HYPH|nr:N-acetylmuramic acid 6-phosphate etherase [Microvirga thermotolerans]QFU17759.1 N-acetylmuramic acid 6-phosphate etherase [Microvirga thermotolerans]